jgi:hypothetical protein
MTSVLEYGMATLYHGEGCTGRTGAKMHQFVKDFGCFMECNPANGPISAYLRRWPDVQIRGYANGDCTGEEVWFDFNKFEKSIGMCLDWSEPVQSYQIWSKKSCKNELNHKNFGMGPTEVWIKNWTQVNEEKAKERLRKKEEFRAKLDAEARAREAANNDEESSQGPDIEGNAEEAAENLYENTKEKTWVYGDRKADNRWTSKPRSRPYD